MAVMVQHQRLVITYPVGIGEHIFIDAVTGMEIVQNEVFRFREKPSATQQREDPHFVPANQPLINLFVPIGTLVLHAVFFVKALDLTMAEHRQTGHGYQQNAGAEILPLRTELGNRRFFIRVIHEIDEALENFVIEFQHVFDGFTVLGVFLGLEHVHKSAVVDPVHTEGSDEIPLHHPERLRQQQRTGRLRSDTVHHLTPELHRENRVKLILAHAMLNTGRYSAAKTAQRKPETLVMLFCQGHGGIKADNREITGNMEDGLDDRFPQLRDQVVKLRRIVPGDTGAVIAVVDITGPSIAPIIVLEDDGGIALVPVAVLHLQSYRRVGRKVFTGELVGRERRIIGLDEPVRVLDHPAGIDAGVIRHHIACQSYTTAAGTLTEARQRFPPTKISGHFIVIQRVGRSDGIRIPADLLDPLGCGGTLPQPYQPEAGEPPGRQSVKFRVRHLIKTGDGEPEGTAQLIKPDVDHLGHHDHMGHPAGIGREVFIFGIIEAVENGVCSRRSAGIADVLPGTPELENRRRARITATAAALPLLLLEDIKSDFNFQQQFRWQNILPLCPKIGNLAGQRIGGCRDRRHEGLDQGASFLGKNRPVLEGEIEGLNNVRVL